MDSGEEYESVVCRKINVTHFFKAVGELSFQLIFSTIMTAILINLQHKIKIKVGKVGNERGKQQEYSSTYVKLRGLGFIITNPMIEGSIYGI